AELRLRAYDMLAEELFTAHLGQALDLALTGVAADGGAASERHYRVLARAKTGALVRIAARLGAIAAGASAEREAALAAWAGEIGLAYQIRDDLEDAAGALGDVAAGRLSYARVARVAEHTAASAGAAAAGPFDAAREGDRDLAGAGNGTGDGAAALPDELA